VKNAFLNDTLMERVYCT
jgi:hypothetical protein